MEHGPLLAITLTLVVHLVGICALLALAGGDLLDMLRMRPDDGRDDGGPGFDEPQDDPSPGGDGRVPPLPDAAPAPVRLREPGRIGPHYRRERRPAREPEREPTRPSAAPSSRP
jgi:hypothetical protein